MRTGCEGGCGIGLDEHMREHAWWGDEVLVAEPPKHAPTRCRFIKALRAAAKDRYPAWRPTISPLPLDALLLSIHTTHGATHYCVSEAISPRVIDALGPDEAVEVALGGLHRRIAAADFAEVRP